jgi:hypothetical protein
MTDFGSPVSDMLAMVQAQQKQLQAQAMATVAAQQAIAAAAAQAAAAVKPVTPAVLPHIQQIAHTQIVAAHQIALATTPPPPPRVVKLALKGVNIPSLQPAAVSAPTLPVITPALPTTPTTAVVPTSGINKKALAAAGAGAVAGFMVAGPPGAAIGAAVGYLGGQKL